PRLPAAAGAAAIASARSRSQARRRRYSRKQPTPARSPRDFSLPERSPVRANHCRFSRGLMVRDVRTRAPHHEGSRPHPESLRTDPRPHPEERALARVSKDGRESTFCIDPSRRLLRKLLRMRSVFSVILRSIAKRCVSKHEDIEVEIALREHSQILGRPPVTPVVVRHL